jgi:pilus assembly protein CpaF
MNNIALLRTQIHHRILDQYDLARLQSMPRERQHIELQGWIERCLQEERAAINAQEQRQLVEDIQNEMLGLGPLEPLLHDPTISDILVNGPDRIYVERCGLLSRYPARFQDDHHLVKIIEKIVTRVGRRIDESSPMVDARLPDGSRVNAIIPPLAVDGPVLSIRRFGQAPLTLELLLKGGSLSAEMADLLCAYVQARMNILVSGGTGSGKTTLLNALSAFIASEERLITIEDAAELRLHQSHVVRLETRPSNLEGQGEITQRHLVRNALRMRPDRLIIGEVRGPEALDMLHAMNTGHEGSLTTLHANSPDDALVRLENMVAMGGNSLSPAGIRAQIQGAVQVVVQVARLSDGSRKVVSISELARQRRGRLGTRELFAFAPSGRSTNGIVEGRFLATGQPSQFREKLLRAGATLPNAPFDAMLEYAQ